MSLQNAHQLKPRLHTHSYICDSKCIGSNLKMEAFNLVRSSELSFLSRRAASFTRTQQPFPQKIFVGRANYFEYGVDGSFSSRLLSPNLLAAEKEEAKAVLALFLKKQSLTNAAAAKIVNRSELFIDHLVSRLHSVHKSWYLVGRELTTLEIRDALIPYLETLSEEYGNILADVVENFPNPPVRERSEGNLSKPPINETSAAPISPTNAMSISEKLKEQSDAPVIPSKDTSSSKKLKALARLDDSGPTGKLPSHVVYLIELGMDIDLIREAIRKFPAFAYYSLEGKIKPVVEFLLDLGVPKSDIPTILSRRPQLCGISLSENLIPTMEFLESLGVDKNQWAKVIYRFPALLTYRRQKLKATVDFLYEVGLSAESVSKILTRCPNIISYSVEDKLRPTAEYFKSIGVDVAVILHQSPQTFGLSIEAHLKPLTEFFLGRGYSREDVRTMVSRYGALYTFSLAKNMIPKWEYFLTMKYPKSELVKFPQYFGYSLEKRIKPRYAVVKESGVKLLLNQVLSLSDHEFNKILKRKMKKMLDD